MASTKHLEDILPFYSPDGPKDQNYHDNFMRAKYRVYSLIALDNEGLKIMLRDLNSGDMTTKNCLLAPQANFAGRSLRDIYDYHLRVRDEDETIHPHYFIVADQNDWNTNGVLMVNLQVGRDVEDEWVVGVGRCGADMADCVGANLDIANVDWIDYKEQEQEEWGGENPYKNQRYFKNDPLAGQQSQA